MLYMLLSALAIQGSFGIRYLVGQFTAQLNTRFL